jgi:hypothetical protein
VSFARSRPGIRVARRSARRRVSRSGATRRPGLRLALSVWWRGAELDRRLAAGEDPWASDALTLRANRITAPRHRTRVANGLAGALSSARGSRTGFTAAVRPHAPDVLEAGVLIATIERRLRDPGPVAPRGVAIVRSLLVDGNSSLYQPDGAGTLGSRLRAAAAALGACPGDG